MFLVNYSCFLKRIEKNLVNHKFFGSCARSSILGPNQWGLCQVQSRTRILGMHFKNLGFLF